MDSPAPQNRQTNLRDAFADKFNQPAQFIARAPGRVNLVGEHIDYHGFGVLPMAIKQAVTMAVAPNNATHVHLANLDSSQYPDFRSDVNDFNFNHMSKPQWHHYVLCGLKGVQEELPGDGRLPGMDMMVYGDIPPNAGLSSSSAMVCCAALATAKVCGLENELNAERLATVCAKSERYIGTEGGGMDQAISFLARDGWAKLIEFDPLRSTDIPLPEGLTFVVANSCVQLNKAATSHFNTRVAEGRIAVQILAKVHNLDWRDVRRGVQLQEALGLSLGSLVQLVERTFKETAYTRAEVCQLLGISEQDLVDTCLTAMSRDVQQFHLRKRLRHVFNEADRVRLFKDVCLSNKECGDGEEAGRELGRLMQESHASCRDDYECSCGELDELVDVMQSSGAWGARLTGAGWGGCAVAILPAKHQETFLTKITQGFFNKRPNRQSNLSQALFLTTPANGASIQTSI